MAESLPYQEERKEEVIDGKIVVMSPVSTVHAYVVGSIFIIFKNYLEGKPCVPFSSGPLVRLSDTNKFFPDVIVVCDRDKIKRTYINGAPDLVVEVLSPSTAKNDRMHKKDVYSRCGVREYWLVSPEEKSIEIYRTNGTELIFYDIYALYPDWQLTQMTDEERAAVVTHFQCSLFDDLEISLADIFYRTF